MYFDLRAILFFFANALLLHLCLMINSALAGFAVYLFMLGPMLVLPSLYMRHSAYFLCILATGLWVDAALPLQFGVFTLGFLVAGAVVFPLRMRFRAERNYHPALIAHATNLFLSAIATISAVGKIEIVSTFWIQLSLTLILSHSLLLFIAPWFFNFQRLLLEVLHLDPDPEDLPLL